MLKVDSIRSVTPTVCRLMGLPVPASCASPPVAGVVEAGRAGATGRVLVFCPDAIANNILDPRPELTARIRRQAPLQVQTTAEVPSLTPVCYASVFTGAPPEVHGIRRYERPVLKMETLFDVAIAAGLSPAIVAVKDSSIDLIFRGRAMDYFSEPSDEAVTERTCELISSGRHRLVVSYVCAHDDALHKHTPYAPEALAAAESNLGQFDRICACCRHFWSDTAWVTVFAPDHGSHVNPATGRGTHGDDCDDDLRVCHFYGIGGTPEEGTARGATTA